MTISFERRFENWVRWCRSSGLFLGKAGSAEGEYRSGQVWEERLPSGPEVDVVDAVFLNAVFMELEARVRRIVKILYFRSHWRPQWQAQKIGCRADDLIEKRAWALGVFERALLAAEAKKGYVSRNGPPFFRPSGAGLTLNSL
jgi:hypothetical protein